MTITDEYREALSRLPAIALSVLLHAVFLIILLSIAPKILPEDQSQPEPIEIDLIAPPPPPSANEPEPAPEAASMAPSGAAIEAPGQVVSESGELPPPPPEPLADNDGMIRPQRMLSGSVLAMAGNAKGRAEYQGLTSGERHEQLCALEAISQIPEWNSDYKPERLVSYTFADVRYENNHVLADGAAFWSKGDWHHIKYDCELSADFESVLSFAFQVGVVVPKKDWEQYYLTEYE